MLQWMSEHTLRDRIQNEDIGKDLVIANIEKMKFEIQLFKMVWACATTGTQQTGTEDRKLELERLEKGEKMTWRTRVEKDIKDLDLQIEMVENRNKWRKIHIDDSWN